MQLLFKIRAVSQVRSSLIWTTNRKLNEPLPVDPGGLPYKREGDDRRLAWVESKLQALVSLRVVTGLNANIAYKMYTYNCV